MLLLVNVACDDFGRFWDVTMHVLEFCPFLLVDEGKLWRTAEQA